MGTLRSNKAVGDLQGMVGGLVYVHRADGTVTVRRAPERRADSTDSQLTGQGRFRNAQLYLKRLKANPEQYAPYQVAAKIRRKRPCDLAMSDFLKMPALSDIDLTKYRGGPGEVICVQAVDDFEVNSVTVAVSHLDGVLIEQGPAAWVASLQAWRYATQAAVAAGETVIVYVVATDRPGNVITKTVHHALLVH